MVQITITAGSFRWLIPLALAVSTFTMAWTLWLSVYDIGFSCDPDFETCDPRVDLLEIKVNNELGALRFWSFVNWATTVVLMFFLYPMVKRPVDALPP